MDILIHICVMISGIFMGGIGLYMVWGSIQIFTALVK